MPETAQQISEKPEVRKELARYARTCAYRLCDSLLSHRLEVHSALANGGRFQPTHSPRLRFNRSHSCDRESRASLCDRANRGCSHSVYSPAHSVSGGRSVDRRHRHLGDLCELVRGAHRTRHRLDHCRFSRANADEKFYRLDLYSRPKSLSSWRPHQDRRRYRRCDRRRLSRHDAVGIGGQYISGDHPSGRVIKFPNEKVLDELVYNYSWPLFPYIWNEIKFQIAYQSDLEFVAKTMQKIVEEELGEEMMKRIAVYRDLLARTPVDELEVREHPRVIFRVDEVTWIDAIVRYLIAPREAGSTKSRLIPKLLAALNAAPEKVMFPKGDAR